MCISRSVHPACPRCIPNGHESKIARSGRAHDHAGSSRVLRNLPARDVLLTVNGDDFRRDSDLFLECARNPVAQSRIQAAMKRGLQTRDAEMALARLLGELADR